MTQRRYHDDEVRKIFGLATTQNMAEPSAPVSTGGLTLSEMQSIGLEVGLEPEAVARAAAVFEGGAEPPLRTSLGSPIEVARTIPLPRALTDHEWEQLVAELRTTFRAKGQIATQGALREWRNGNLHVLVEPAGTGYRLRMDTIKGDAITVDALSGVSVVTSAIVFASLAYWGFPASFGDAALYVIPTILGGGGIGALVNNRSRLARWVKQRNEQMSHIANRILSIMGTKSERSDSLSTGERE